jgi:hypothetical protein
MGLQDFMHVYTVLGSFYYECTPKITIDVFGVLVSGTKINNHCENVVGPFGQVKSVGGCQALC